MIALRLRVDDVGLDVAESVGTMCADGAQEQRDSGSAQPVERGSVSYGIDGMTTALGDGVQIVADDVG